MSHFVNHSCCQFYSQFLFSMLLFGFSGNLIDLRRTKSSTIRNSHLSYWPLKIKGAIRINSDRVGYVTRSLSHSTVEKCKHVRVSLTAMLHTIAEFNALELLVVRNKICRAYCIVLKYSRISLSTFRSDFGHNRTCAADWQRLWRERSFFIFKFLKQTVW